MRSSVVVFAWLATVLGCGGDPKQVPYYGECHCECAVELQPCATRGMIDCDVEGRTAHYEQFFTASCADFESAKGYFNCGLVDVGQPGEPSPKVTSLNPVDVAYCTPK